MQQVSEQKRTKSVSQSVSQSDRQTEKQADKEPDRQIHIHAETFRQADNTSEFRIVSHSVDNVGSTSP